jgi:hypothetical protein
MLSKIFRQRTWNILVEQYSQEACFVIACAEA